MSPLTKVWQSGYRRDVVKSGSGCDQGIETGAATFCHSLRMDFTGLTPAVMGYLDDLYRLYRQSFFESGLWPKIRIGQLARAAGIMKMKIHQNMVKFCLTLFIMLVATHIHAHTGLKESTPAADSRVQAVPLQTELIFTGPVRLISLMWSNSEPKLPSARHRSLNPFTHSAAGLERRVRGSVGCHRC